MLKNIDSQLKGSPTCQLSMKLLEGNAEDFESLKQLGIPRISKYRAMLLLEKGRFEDAGKEFSSLKETGQPLDYERRCAKGLFVLRSIQNTMTMRPKRLFSRCFSRQT